MTFKNLAALISLMCLLNASAFGEDLHITSNQPQTVSHLNATVYGQGACTNSDQRQTIHHYSPEFVENWQECGRSSWGKETQFGQCMETRHPNISKPCINCFSQFTGCTRSNCWFKCIGITQKWCEECALKNCEPALVNCTGVSKDNLPSKYATP